MATTEHTINDAIAAVLRETRSAWRSSDIVRSENTAMLRGSNARPDILVLEPKVAPVVIETEVLPAVTVEADAMARLGTQIRNTGRTILSSVAVRLPTRLRTLQGNYLRVALESAMDLEFALLTGSSTATYVRYPRDGWIIGSIADLSILTQSATIPPEIIEVAADQLVTGVSEAAGLMGELAGTHPGALNKIADELHQEDGVQTRRMAATILSNAFMFHETLARGSGGLAKVQTLDELKSGKGGLSKAGVLAEWEEILKVNYWPIFDIARRILMPIPIAESKFLIEGLIETAGKLLQNQLMRSHDLTGAVFQRLIADRKFLAAFYTTPASAALLIGLAISPDAPPAGGSWVNTEDVLKIRMADFACGIGTLLGTGYQRIGQLHEMAGGDAEVIHAQMMADSLVGCDVLPAAAHLTASTLAGTHPTVQYEESSIFTVPYGKQENGKAALGSLDLLNPQGELEFDSITAKASEGMGEAEKETRLEVRHETFHLVLMNPPFTRATGHEGKKIGVPNPMFAAFKSSAEAQKLMGAAMKTLTKGTGNHGNAGEAAYFLILADRKLTRTGTLGLVMPLSLILGEAWEDSRVLLHKNYTGLIVVSISGTDDESTSFSADTGMGECIVVGTKAEVAGDRGTFVVLKERPAFPLLGSTVATQIRRLIVGNNFRRLEDGPIGGTPILFGNEVVGYALDAPLPSKGSWHIARIADLSLAQTSYEMESNQRIWLPGMSQVNVHPIPISTISAIGKIGPYHSDISGDTATGKIRGPFEVSAVEAGSAPTYPILWGHEASRERTMSFEGDSEGLIRLGSTAMEQKMVDLKVATILSSASHCHFNRDFRFNSQSTGMQFTPRRTIGGTSWISIQLESVEKEKAIVCWANTSLGMLLRWWHSNKTQSGRGRIGIVALGTLPILDVNSLSAEQLKNATRIFDELKDKEMLPIHEIDRDAVRQELDERFSREVLGIMDTAFYEEGGPLDLLRMKVSREPSIRGSK